VRARVRVRFEEMAQPRFVKIAHRRFAVGADPFGMLPTQIVVNLLLKLGHGVDRVTYLKGPGHYLWRSKHICWTRGSLDLFIRKKWQVACAE
jgi:hypothetical protein